ncbi:MAG: BrnT family toxin [Elusimicrobia bacterium]|nr:BrnT family toxin [Elusimicrobiota bacterium]
MPNFEHDPKKSLANQERHGIDLTKAQELWQATHVVIPARNVLGENRYAILGKIGRKLFVAIFTQREDGIRLISCHRADKRWERVYEKYVQKED